jgi:sulfite exporter TauE/SafE
MGIVILGLAVLYFLRKWSSRPVFLRGFYRSVQNIIIRILKSSTTSFSFLMLGMANGLLPCGMVYIAIASSLSFYQVSESVSFMAMFGAGTAPAMMLVSYAGQLMSPGWRNSLRKLTPVFMSLMGALLILRGLNLGIPFISPELPQAPGSAVICHP